MREYAKNELEKLFPKKGIEYELCIYEYVLQTMSEFPGFDFYQFRNEYKRKLLSILQNMEFENSNLKKILNEIHLSQIIHQESQEFEPNLWCNNSEEIVNESEIREGAFMCTNCQRKGLYAKNTTFYEKQTRSADDPSTIFLHCHSCNKDYRFSS